MWDKRFASNFAPFWWITAIRQNSRPSLQTPLFFLHFGGHFYALLHGCSWERFPALEITWKPVWRWCTILFSPIEALKLQLTCKPDIFTNNNCNRNKKSYNSHTWKIIKLQLQALQVKCNEIRELLSLYRWWLTTRPSGSSALFQWSDVEWSTLCSTIRNILICKQKVIVAVKKTSALKHQTTPILEDTKQYTNRGLCHWWWDLTCVV